MFSGGYRYYYRALTKGTTFSPEALGVNLIETLAFLELDKEGRRWHLAKNLAKRADILPTDRVMLVPQINRHFGAAWVEIWNERKWDGRRHLTENACSEEFGRRLTKIPTNPQ
jgi:DNA-binding transcriptional regulator/RsmH inhibitor MraZ